MKTMKNLVSLVLMSIATAATITFTACTDDFEEAGFTSQEPEATEKAELLEAYGLSFKTFNADDDVVILDRDTTQISVSREYAEKLGIRSFVNHPMGIWHKMNQLPYIRKATAEHLEGDRYIIDVEPASIAELVGDKAVQLQTDIFINNNPSALRTRAGGSNIPDYAAKYMDENNVVHPVAILMTDPYGYDKDVHYADDKPSEAQTRAAQTGEYQYITAEELASGNTRWGTRCRLVDVNTELKKEFKFAAKGRKDSMHVALTSQIEFGLNYFLTLEGGIQWHGILPDPYVKKFETGVDGHFGLNAEVELGYEMKAEIEEDQLKYELCRFPGYTFTFFIGPLPVAIKITPNMFMKVDGEVSGAVTMGFSYEYKNKFMGGVRYTPESKWEGMGSFEEVANEFNLYPARFSFHAKGGVGLYLGADVMLYDCAGPKISVGPRLGGEIDAKLTPFEGNKKYDDWGDFYEFNTQIDLSINAVIGAKLSILGYELAETSTTIPLIDPWVLFKLPSDGTEHKSPKGKKEEETKNLYAEILNEIFKSDSVMHSRYEEMATMLMDLNGGMRQQAEDNIYKEVKKTVSINDKADKELLQSQTKVALRNYYDVVKPQHEAMVKAMNWKEFVETLKQMPDFQKFVDRYYDAYRVTVDLDLLHRHFVLKNHGDEPLQTQQDYQIFVYYLQRYGEILYQNSPEMQKRFSKDFIRNMMNLYDDNSVTREQKEIAAYETLLKLSMRYKSFNFDNIEWNNVGNRERRIVKDEYMRLLNEVVFKR